MKHYHYPVRVEDVREFSHPDPNDAFGDVFRWGEDWGVANGFLALRISSWLDCERDCPEAVERVERLRWSFFDHPTEKADWGKLDDRRGGLWKRGEAKFWNQSQSGKWYRRTLRNIAVGDAGVRLTWATLQLISKLPRVEIYIRNAGHRDWAFFRFNGGTGIAMAVAEKAPQAIYSLWQRPDDRMGGGMLI